jgi:very-short-patch-repair endonuclease
MGDKRNTDDARVAAIAARQHGLVTLRQLEAAGLGRRGASRREKTGRLHRVHRGVYAVGHRPPSLHARWMAAVLACGDGAVLSHSSAAALWGLLRPIDGPVHVSVPTERARRSRRGIHVHRCPSLAFPRGKPLMTHHDRIPVTTVQRTLDDLDGRLPSHLVRRARRQAELRGVRLDRVEGARTRSDLEDDFLALCRHHRLPRPQTNVRIGRWEVDFLWGERRLVAETDSFAYHRGSVAFEDDHARDLDLRGQGFGVLRFTGDQLEHEPDRVAADVRAALRRVGA